MNKVCPIMASLLLIIVAVMISSKSSTEAKHWPDFSCLPHKNSRYQQNYFKHNRVAWNSCQASHKKDKQECDKMCALRNGDVIMKTKKEEPFRFYTEAFITVMLNELGFEDEHLAEAPQGLVKNVTEALNVCKTKYREFETMTNVQYLPCEPYNPLFKCIEDAVVRAKRNSDPLYNIYFEHT